MNYDEIITSAMRNALYSIFKKVEKKGLLGDHYFLVSFLTNHQNTVLSERVKRMYPEEITIILQHQFKNLKAKEDHFEVELSFNSIPEIIKVPYDAITSFSDPSVNFELVFDGILPYSKEEKKEEDLKINEEESNLIDFNLLLKNRKQK